MNAPQAILFVTHIISAKIYNHFVRLKTETQNVLDAYLCVCEPARHCDTNKFSADFWISRREEKNLAPKRYAEKKYRGGGVLPGFNDLANAPALLSSQLLEYRYIWVVEYDVDFLNWQNFCGSGKS